MGKALNIAAAALILGAATGAFAAETQHRTTGRIKAVDLMKHIVALDNGAVYKAARGVNLRRLKTGEKVTLTISKFGGVPEAVTIAPAAD
jgi:Cu/Ag efflux protein CusF